MDLMNILYNVSMLLLIFTAALVATKSIGKWAERSRKKEEKKKEDKSDTTAKP